MYKIFFYDRLVGICNDWATCSRPNAIVCKGTKKSEIKNIVSRFRQNRAMRELWLLTENPEEALDEVAALFTLIEAAGGVVRNAQGELLLIFRHGHWDLPKGKRESGEAMAETALREVEEECGISGLMLHHLLGYSYHVYGNGEADALKKTHWFSMRYDGHAPLVVQEAEGIEEARWVTPAQLPAYFPKMFSSIVDLLQRVVL
ncbi:MAG: NUDIX domain-containing protein [Prevotellaceae bacterium]|jgi:8-oxo-dGTP pyrophosphatase MutT (NUDIX family)|nr:NUDIX domain-containing protein [Prevotellaceae bacterium]